MLGVYVFGKAEKRHWISWAMAWGETVKVSAAGIRGSCSSGVRLPPGSGTGCRLPPGERGLGSGERARR